MLIYVGSSLSTFNVTKEIGGKSRRNCFFQMHKLPAMYGSLRSTQLLLCPFKVPIHTTLLSLITLLLPFLIPFLSLIPRRETRRGQATDPCLPVNRFRPTTCARGNIDFRVIFSYFCCINKCAQ